MDTRKVLGSAIELELETSKCYERLRRMPGAEPFAGDLERLAKEEIVHANLLKTGRSYESSDPESFGDIFLSLEQLEEDLHAAKRLVADIDAGNVAFEEALERVRDLEFAFEQAHLAALVEVNDPRLRELFKALSFDDGHHKRMLEDILRDLRL